MTDVADIAKEGCETCRFGGGRWQFIAPDPLPDPVERRTLFGLIRWQEKPSRWAQSLYEHRVEQVENMVPCCRFPKEMAVKKTHWCGEFEPALSNMEA